MLEFTREDMDKQRLLDLSRANEYELEPHLIDDGKEHPFALVIPGGGYEFVSNWNEGIPFTIELNKRGISAFVLYYPVMEKAKYPAPHEAVAKALRHIFENAEKYNVSTEKYMIWGSSAGGHLAATYSTNFDDFTPELPRPALSVLIYPVITMLNQTHEGSRNMLLGQDASEEMKTKMSAQLNVDEKTNPMFIWCGLSDTCVPPVNSYMMSEALHNHGIKHKLVTYENVEHGVGLGLYDLCEGWIDKAIDYYFDEIYN